MEKMMSKSMETYYITLALMESEEASISGDDLLLLAEGYAELKHIADSSAEEWSAS